MNKINPQTFIDRLNSYSSFLDKNKGHKYSNFYKEKIKTISEFLKENQNYRAIAPEKYDLINKTISTTLFDLSERSQNIFQKRLSVTYPLTKEQFKDLEALISQLDPEVHAPLLSLLNQAKESASIDTGLLKYKNNNGETLLHLLASKKQGIHLLQKLVDSGMDVNTKNKQGLTPVHFAIRNKNTPNLKRLINSKTFDESIKSSNENYVEWTFKKNYPEGVDLLLTHTKIHPDTCKCTYKVTKKDLGENFPRLTLLQAASIQNDTKLISILIKHGANPNIGNEHEFNKVDLRVINDKALYFSYIKPPLYCALLAGNLEAIKVLLENGADPNKPVPANENAIYFYNQPVDVYPSDLFVSYLYFLDTEKISTTDSNRDEMRQLLIKYGADTNVYESIKLHKEFGHIWGIGDEKNFSTQDKCTYRYEGGHDKPDSDIIQKNLKDFTEKRVNEKDSFFDENTLKNINYVIENLYKDGNSKEKDSSKILEDIANGMPVIINTGWTKHSTNIIFYKDLVIKINKGDQRDNAFAIKIFKANAPLTTQVIDNLRIQPKTTSDYFLYIIDNDLHLTPLEEISLPMKNQSVGNCSLVSKKASIYALFYISALEHSNSQINENAKSISKELYKSYTSESRLKSLENVYAQLKKDPSTIDWVALGEARIKIEERYREAKFFGKEKDNIEATLKIFEKIDNDSELLTQSISNPSFIHYYTIEKKLNPLINVNFTKNPDLLAIQSNTTILHTAVMANDRNVVEYILKNDLININSCPGNASPLHIAVKYNQIEMVQLLLEHGANINLIIPPKGSPLLYAIGRDTNQGIIELLLKNGASIKNENILLHAVITKNENLVRTLSQYGADIFSDTVISPTYKTSSYREASRRSPRIQNIMIRQEIKNIENLQKILPLNSSLNLVLTQSKMDLKKNKEVSDRWYNLKDEKGLSFLHYAILSEDKNIINYLTEKFNIDINTKDSLGNTPLHYAVRKKNIEAINVLLSNNADPNQVNHSKLTPFLTSFNDKTINSKTMSEIYECFEKFGYELTQDRLFINSKFIGQNWGIGDGMTFKFNELDISYENFGRLSSAKCFEEELNEFTEKHEQDPFYTPAVIQNLEYIQKSMQKNLLDFTTSTKILKDLNNNHPILLSTGWDNHTAGIVLYKGYVVKCNKGKGQDSYGITFYKPTKGITNEILDKIRNNTDEAFYLHDIDQELGLELVPEMSVKIKPQATANCVVASQKAMLHAFFLLEAKDHPLSEIRDNPVGKANEEYKSFTSFSRYHTLKSYYENIIDTPNNIDWLMLSNIRLKNNEKLKTLDPNTQEYRHYLKVQKILEKFNEFSDVEATNPKLNPTLIYNFVSNGNKEVIKNMLSDGLNINKIEGSTTPLHIAVKSGNMEMIEFLIENGADPSIVNAKNNTPLHMAANEGNITAFKTLLNKNVDLKIKGNFNLTPLEMAVVYGHEDFLFNLTKEHLDQIDLSNLIALSLHLNKHVFLDQFIAKYNIDVNTLSLKGSSLLQAAINKNKLEDVQFLMKHRANPNFGNPPPIILATRIKNENILDALLANKADINAKTIRGSNALFDAIATGNLKIAEKLISLGIEINAKDLNGITPLWIAIKKNNFEMVKLLVDNDANVNSYTENGNFILLEAMKKQDRRIVSYLASSKNFDIQTLNSKGQSIIHLAIINKDMESLQALSKYIDVNQKNRFGNSLLHTAIIQNNLQALEFLLRIGYTEILDSKGLTPLQLAMHQKKSKMVELINEMHPNKTA